MKVSKLGLALIVLPLLWPAASSAADSAHDRRIERLERQGDEIRKEMRAKRAELSRLEREAARLTGVDREARTAQVRAQRSELESLQEDLAELDRKIEREEKSKERAESARVQAQASQTQAQRASTFRDCATCQVNRVGGASSAPQQPSRSNWDNINDLVKAITPLGVAGMSTWLGYQSQQTASSDYRFYANSMLSNGLSISAPNYGATNSMTGLGSMGAYGMGNMYGMGSMFGMGGQYSMGAMQMPYGSGFGMGMGYGMMRYR